MSHYFSSILGGMIKPVSEVIHPQETRAAKTPNPAKIMHMITNGNTAGIYV